MDPATTHEEEVEADAQASVDFWRRLLHRWLVQYNPLYLLSASLCLAGMILCSRGLARTGSVQGELGVAAIAELYAVALIGGAALLTRIGQRRPAVLLALITALYQCDLTLHTEACALLGSVGVAATAAWIFFFVAKLYALAWAVRLRISISAAAVATAGAIGMSVLPHYLHGLPARSATGLVALWLFALFALGLHTARTVTSAVELDGWGQTVLRRALRAVWLLWSLLLVLHVLFWSLNYAIQLAALVPVALLLGTRWIRSESRVWLAVVGMLVLVGVQLPAHFAVTALMAAVVLALRTMRQPLATPPSAARRRLLTGAIFGAYLAVWTLGWTGGSWPAHLVALDLALTAAVVVVVARARIRIALAPLAATFAHFALQARVVSAPASTLEWGVMSVALGFVLLLGSLTGSYWLRNVDPRKPYDRKAL